MTLAPPRIAILLPVRDAAPTLDAALESLWRQTVRDFEVVAVDDGSTDRGPDILARHARRQPRLRVLSTGPRGLVPALETARAATGAPNLARMDADDLCHPDRLRRQLAYLEAHPRVAAVGCRVALFPRRRLGAGWRRYQAWLNGLLTPEDHARECFVESPLAHPSVLLRAEAVDAAGGYQDRGWAEDYDLWLRLAAAGWGLAKVPATLLAWRHGPGRHSLTSPRYHRRAFLRARAHYLARHPVLAGGRTALWGVGTTGRDLARRLGEHGIRVSQFYEVDPKRIGTRFLDAPVVSWLRLEPAGRLPLVVAVGAPGARGLIRAEARRQGYREGRDFFFAG